jgi:integrase
MATGIRKRHSRRCRSRDGAGGVCDCSPSFEAFVWSRRYKAKITRTFPTFADAKTWRAEATSAVDRGRLRRSTRKTIREASVELIDGMRDGSIRSSRRRPYRPSTIRSYERATGVWPEQRERAPERLCERLGELRLTDADRHVIQAYVERLLSAGWDPSTAAGQLDPLRVMFRVARSRDEVAIDPLEGVDLPKPQGRRERIASPAEAAALVVALSLEDRAVWASAFYAGLRRGELRALRVRDIAFDNGIIHVARSWDDEAGELKDAKTDAGRRDVPIVGALRGELQRHLLRTGRRGDHLLLGETPDEPFVPTRVRRRALAAWEAAGLEAITLHEGRHTFASTLIAAGVDLKQVSEYMGHAGIGITADRYAHLLAGARDQAVRQVDAFLADHAQARLRL